MPAPGVSRRAFLGLVVAGVTAACTSGSDTASEAPPTTRRAFPEVPVAPTIRADPFQLGVASGDPLPDSVILWTRLIGDDLPDGPVELLWEIAGDEAFTSVEASGLAQARPELAHSVHVDARGLEADRWYWYRFRLGDWTSPAGRTRTTPQPDADPVDGRVRVGFASCQDWQDGYYSAYPHVPAEGLDLLLFLGDYIYEGGVGTNGVRQHDGPEVTDLDGYRKRYALYKSDAGLQAAHAACPWVVTWDDHEVDNDYAGDVSEHRDPTAAFDERRAAAYQAFYEHQPVRLDPPDGDSLELYRDVPWGTLASFFVLDGRQYRTDQPCTQDSPVPFAGACAEVDDPSHTMLGDQQRSWLIDGLTTSGAVWDVLANQTVMTRMPIASVYNLDQWDGYPTDRATILGAASDASTNLVVVTGDIHGFMVGDVQATPDGPTVASEFVGGSISSGFPAEVASFVTDNVGALPQFPFVDFVDHGYGVLELTPTLCRCDLRAVSTTKEPTGEIRTLSSWTVEPGARGPTRVG